MKRQVLLCAVLFALSAVCGRAQAGWANTDDEREYITCLSGYAGYNTLQQGFDGYRPYAAIGLDWYMIPDEPSYSVDDGDLWKENIFYRISLDYFPMVVPEGNYGTTEDMLGIGGDLLYYCYRGRRADIFLGLGLGYYMDMISVDTPATGKAVSQYYFFGARPSIGAIIRLNENYSLIPEIRGHWMLIVNNYYTINTVYQIGLSRRFQ